MSANHVEEFYDTLIVGAGTAGLNTAAMLAASGHMRE